MTIFFYRKTIIAGLLITGLFSSSPLFAAGCEGLPTHQQLKDALTAVVSNSAGGTGVSNGGLNFPMWATVLNRAGVVCAVVKTGDAWPGSRAISAQKANTANAFSRRGFALSTANLWAPVQGGSATSTALGSLFGLQQSNPVDPAVVYRGNANAYGSSSDGMLGLKPGGVNVFGGGLAIYANEAPNAPVLGALGVSGDTSCADHNIAMKLRLQLAIDGAIATAKVPAGVCGDAAKCALGNFAVGTSTDNIIYGTASDGFTHPLCGNGEQAISEAL